LIKCPECGGYAITQSREYNSQVPNFPWTITCRHCNWFEVKKSEEIKNG